MGSEGDAKKEWLELKNVSTGTVSLAGWELLDKSQRIDVRFNNAALKIGELRLVRRGADFSGTINNSDEALYLFDDACTLVDEVAANPAWPAGDADGRTAERGTDFSWHTSAEIGGTPGKENSEAEHTPSDEQQATEEKSSTMARAAISDAAVSANFSALRISEVMAGKRGDADFDFVELYNNSDTPMLLTGVSTKKKSSTGKESTLVAASRFEGKFIPPRSYFLLANEKGYTDAMRPDITWPASYSLAAENNGVALYGKGGTRIDEAVWQKIPDGQSLVRDGWDARTFHIVATPAPQNSRTQ